MTARERTMVESLVWVAAFALCGVSVFLSSERVRAAEAAASKYRERLVQLELVPRNDGGMEARTSEIRSRVEAEEARAAAAAVTGLSEFGRQVRGLLSAAGVETLRYQTVRSEKGELLEFSCRSSAEDFLEFLRAASADRRRWSLPYLSMRTAGDGRSVDAVFRISDD